MWPDSDLVVHKFFSVCSEYEYAVVSVVVIREDHVKSIMDLLLAVCTV